MRGQKVGRVILREKGGLAGCVDRRLGGQVRIGRYAYIGERAGRWTEGWASTKQSKAKCIC
jgi:hypothetical protein